MPKKHDRTAESHAGVLGQKKNFFSSFTYTGWGEVILCLRNTIEQLNHTLGFSGRSKNNFFSSFTYTGWWGSYIMHEKHDQTAESHAGVPGQIKKNFFSSFTYTGWGELYYASETRSNS